MDSSDNKRTDTKLTIYYRVLRNALPTKLIHSSRSLISPQPPYGLIFLREALGLRPLSNRSELGKRLLF